MSASAKDAQERKWRLDRRAVLRFR